MNPRSEIEVFLRSTDLSPAEGNPASVEVLKVLATKFERDFLNTSMDTNPPIGLFTAQAQTRRRERRVRPLST